MSLQALHINTHILIICTIYFTSFTDKQKKIYILQLHTCIYIPTHIT